MIAPTPVWEAHCHDAEMGDLCRDDASGNWFCPEGCQTTPDFGPPYCIIKDGGGHPSLHSKKSEPCRFPRDFKAGHQRCADSTEMGLDCADTVESTLERHTLAPAHGDVCRAPGVEGFFCPDGCVHVGPAPFCVEITCGRTLPCRVPLPSEVLGFMQGTNDPGLRGLGKDCLKACGGHAGCCEEAKDVCGQAGACCMLDDAGSSREASCEWGRRGCAGRHCCVRAHSVS